MGTFQYMAPEQLEGREADARTDIFAFGALLYEMATGRRAFEGKSQASLIAAIMERQPPPLATVVPLAPPALERVVRQCLAKDPDDRWQSAGDLKRELRWIAAGGAMDAGGTGADPAAGAVAPAATRGPIARFGRFWPVALAGWLVAGLTLTVLGAIVARRSAGPAGAAGSGKVRFTVPPPRGTAFTSAVSDSDFAVSPDGRRIVLRARDGQGTVRLYVRAIETLEPGSLPGTEEAQVPFWSYDGRQIGFFARGRLMRIPTAGGPAEVVCDLDGDPTGGTWSPGGDILFTVSGRPLRRVSERGGTPTDLQSPDPARHETGLRRPRMLPDGRHYLVIGFTPRAEARTLYLGSLDGGAAVPLMKSPFKAEYIEPGFLLFVRGASLVAQPFRMNPPGLTGDPVVVIDTIDIATVPSNSAFSASPNGTIAWTAGQRDAVRTRLVWFDRAGRRIADVGPPAADISVSLSPDGTKAAVGRVSGGGLSPGGEPPTNIWVVDLARGIGTRLTLDPANGDENPIWSPDGRRIAFARHARGNEAEVHEMPAAGGDERPLLPSSTNTHPVDWSPDGTTVLLHVADGNGSQSLAYVRLDGDRAPAPFLATRSNEGQGQFSPDGRFVAYTSDESGSAEVYVRPFPAGTDRWQVSSRGGGEPRWRADGRELFYLAANGTLMAVEVRASPSFTAGTPAPLFPTELRPTEFWYYGGVGVYAPSRDGQRFLINTIETARAPAPINVLLNWRPPALRAR
jgi:Tol biopolymer transport system component